MTPEDEITIKTVTWHRTFTVATIFSSSSLPLDDNLDAATFESIDMSLSSLPNEVILIISENLKKERDIFALLRTSKRFYRLLLSNLYKHNVIYSLSSALPWCVHHENEEGAGLLLSHGATIQHPEILLPLTWEFDEDFGDVLHFAKTPSIAELLLNHGADVNMCTSFGNTPLHIAMQKGQPALVEVFLNYGGRVKAIKQE